MKNKMMRFLEGSKEVGMPANAPKKAKLEDAKADKKAGIKEGSKADLKKDREIMKKYGRK